MTVQIREPNKPVDSNRVRKFEISKGVQLPEQYRAFLLTYNGGRPEPNAFKYKDRSNGSLVDRFFGFDVIKWSDLERHCEIHKDRIPESFIPIAIDPGGNRIVIGISGDDIGKIYFWDHEMEVDDGEEPDMSNMHLVADSFQEFLAGLFEVVID